MRVAPLLRQSVKIHQDCFRVATLAQKHKAEKIGFVRVATLGQIKQDCIRVATLAQKHKAEKIGFALLRFNRMKVTTLSQNIIRIIPKGTRID